MRSRACRASHPASRPQTEPLCASSRRLYDKWGRYQDSTSELYTTFKYSRLTGIGKQAGITRRDPTTVLRIDGTYFVWYTRRQTPHDRDHGNKPPHRQQTWDTPVFDWDLAEIWYATSKDGFHWQEQGVAVQRGPKHAYDGPLGFHARCLDDGRWLLPVFIKPLTTPIARERATASACPKPLRRRDLGSAQSIRFCVRAQRASGWATTTPTKCASMANGTATRCMILSSCGAAESTGSTTRGSPWAGRPAIRAG